MGAGRRVKRDAARQLLDVIRAQKRGSAHGVYSICSANPHVLRAAMSQAKSDGSVACIESTSNQVNQFGGYAGMTPAQFAAFVHGVAAEMKLPRKQVLLGGDHLGPHVWRQESAESAMAKARTLVRDCVSAGYAKIHLDASMRLGGDAGGERTPPSEELITARAAEMCAAAEQAHAEMRGRSPAPVYVIGTEVPVPGGEQEGEPGAAVSRVADVARTIELSRRAFAARGLEAAWGRVVAIVVQPGVEFSDNAVLDYDRAKARKLSAFIKRHSQLVFEAHSTDYQTRPALRQMVEDQFAILKVGPWLTFAFREAVFALADIEREWLGGRAGIEPSNVRQTLEDVMLDDPANWKPYHHGDEAYQRFARKYSYSDRSRYYWPHPRLQSALRQLRENLTAHPPPPTLLHQYLPEVCEPVKAGEIANAPDEMIRYKIMQVTRTYASACGHGA